MYGRRFEIDATPIGASFRIDEDPTQAYDISQCGSDVGGFVVSWREDFSNGAVLARYVTADGVPLGSNVTLTGGDVTPRLPAHCGRYGIVVGDRPDGVSGRVFRIDPPLLGDGFESGSVDRWDAVVPTPSRVGGTRPW